MLNAYVGIANASELVPPSSLPIKIVGPKELRGLDIRKLSISAFDGKTFKPIRFQIDELNDKNEFVLANGLPFTKNSDDGYFDGNDEIVFMRRDVGQCFTDKQLPKKSKGDRFWRVEVSQSDKSVGCVLVQYSLKRDTSRVPGDALVSYDSATQTVRSSKYKYQFHKERAALLGEVWLTSQDEPQLLIQDSSFAIAFVLPWFLPNFQLTEDNFISTVESWQSGPVRTIIAVGVKLRKFLSLFNLHMFSELVFYEGALQIPTVLEFNFDPHKYFKPGTGLAYAVRFNERLVPKVHGNLDPLPAESAKALYENGARAVDKSPVYAVARFPSTNMVVRVRADERLLHESLPPYMLKTADFSDPKMQEYWSWIKDLRGDMGVFVDTSGLRMGSYDFGLDLFLGSEADESIIADFDSTKTVWSAIASH